MSNFFLIIALIFAVWSFFKEPDITGLYKVAGIYGRIYAYIAFAFVFGGLAGIIGVLIGQEKANSIIPITIFFIIGCYMYYRVFAKSPDFLKKRCLFDLAVSGFGVAVRVVLFFMMFFISAWWEANKPRSYILDDGREVYVFPDNRVYDPVKHQYGKANNDRDVVIWD